MNFNEEYENYTKYHNEITNIIKNKECIQKNIDEISIGDYVYITFLPDSQKYIYELHPKYGVIKSIEIINYLNPFTNKNEKHYDIIIKNNDNDNENLLHEGVSFLGGSLGYDYNIYLIK